MRKQKRAVAREKKAKKKAATARRIEKNVKRIAKDKLERLKKSALRARETREKDKLKLRRIKMDANEKVRKAATPKGAEKGVKHALSSLRAINKNLTTFKKAVERAHKSVGKARGNEK